MPSLGFSIIMPTYNRAFCITTAIDSLLAQDYTNWELIIVDDGSSDETESLIYKSYQKYLEIGKIRYFKLNHTGVSRARNKGVSEAKYDWIAYLDTDNALYENFLNTFVSAIQENKEYKIFYAQSQSGRRIIGRNFDRKALKRSNYIDLGAFVHTKELFATLGGFNENLTRLVDWDLILKYTKNNTPFFISRVVLSYNASNEFKRITNTEDLAQNKKIILKAHHIHLKKEKKMFLLKLAKALHLISKEKYKELRTIKLFKKSNLFDRKWYLSQYPDVATAKISAERHYYKYGWKEGRNPSPLFDGNAYLEENDDVMQAQRNPLEHYLLSGQAEGRYYNGIAESENIIAKQRGLKYILTYPMRLKEEYVLLKTEIKLLKTAKRKNFRYTKTAQIIN